EQHPHPSVNVPAGVVVAAVDPEATCDALVLDPEQLDAEVSRERPGERGGSVGDVHVWVAHGPILRARISFSRLASRAGFCSYRSEVMRRVANPAASVSASRLRSFSKELRLEWNGHPSSSAIT